MSSRSSDNEKPRWYHMGIQSIYDKGYTGQARHLPDDVTHGALRIQSPTPFVGGAMDGEGKDFWFTPSNSMIIVICVGSVAILVGVVALVCATIDGQPSSVVHISNSKQKNSSMGKYVIRDGTTKDRCRVRKRPSKSTPEKELYKHQHSLGVYASVQADNSTTDFLYELEGPDKNNNDLKFGSPCFDTATIDVNTGCHNNMPICNSTPSTDDKSENEKDGMQKTAGHLTSNLYNHQMMHV